MPLATPVASTVQTPLRGLSLPLTRVGGGYLRTKDRYDVCWGDLIMVLFCPIGGRAMSRSFGSLVPNAVFEQQAPLLQQRLKQYVQDAAQRWCPHVKVFDVVVQFDGASTKRAIVLSVAFAPADEPAAQKRTVRLDRSATLRALGSRNNS